MKYFFLCLPFLLFHLSFSQNDAILDFGQNLIYKNKLDEAIIYYKKHLIKPDSKKQEIKLFLGLADVYKLKLDYRNANNNYVKSYNEIIKLKDKQLEFLYYVKKAEFFRKRSIYIEAVSQLDKAAMILKENKIEDIYLSKYYNRKAALFTEYYHIQDSTIFYANKSLYLAKKIKDKDNVFYSLLEIAGVYERKKDYKTAIRYLEEIIQFAKSNNMQQQEADAYISYIMALARNNQLKKALDVALYAANFSKINNLLYNEIIFNENIQNLYFRLNNTEKAYEYLRYRLELTTKYDEVQKEELLLNVEAKYKLAEKENQIKINKLEIENQNKALASSKTKLYIIIGLFLITIIGILLIAYFLRKSKEDNKQLKALSKENEFLLSEANHRINNNLQLVVILILDQLKKASDTESIQLKNILTKVESISTLHKHLYKSNDKNKIDVSNYLNDVKSGFFDIFKEQDIKTNFKVEAVEIPSDYAMYLGLLLTELFINSIKHAFGNQKNKNINFQLGQINDALSFNYSDNGTTTSNQDNKPKLIDKLCRQLKIDYKINTESGFSFSFVTEISND